MAIPTVLNNSDFPTIDFTDSGARFQNMYDALKSGLVTLGWTIEFETLNEAIVFSNAGSGYMFKIRPDGTSKTYMFIETAQSWTDIDTPVNQLANQRFVMASLGSTNSKFQIIGDDKRFYCTTLIDDSQFSGSARVFFMGDIVPFNTTDPYVFLFIGQTGDPMSTSYPSTSQRGLVLSPDNYLYSGDASKKGSLFGAQDGTLGETPVTLISPGNRSSSVSQDIVVSEINADQPTMLIPTYVYQVDGDEVIDGTPYGNRGRGILPGYHSSIAPSKILLSADRLSQTTVAGANVIPYLSNSSSYGTNCAIVLNDWDNLL